MKAVVYARVSSREQEKEGFSIPAQLKLLHEYAQKQGLDVVRIFQEAETAKKAGRTEFNEMLDFLRVAKEPHCLLVEKTDRLYRNFKDYVRLEELDVEVHLVKESVILSNNSKSHEKFIHGIKVLVAKNYIDNLSEEVKKGMHEKACQGHFPFKAPYGYMNNRQTRMIEICNEEAPLVRRAFSLYKGGQYSLDQVRQMLLDEGFCFRASKPKIQKGTLESMLKNIFYTGDFVIKGQFYRGKHQPIVSLEEFEQTQKAFNKLNRQKQVKHDFAFAGLMTCGHCGCAITGQIQRGKYIYYHCTNYKGECKDPYIREEAIDEQFGNALKALNVDQHFVDWVIEALKSSHKDEIQFHEDRIQDLRSQYDRLSKRIELIYEDKLDGKITEDLWSRKSDEYQRELTRVESSLQQHTKGNFDYVQSGSRILELAKNAFQLYETSSNLEKRRILNLVLSNCILQGGKVGYTYKKPFNYLVEGADCQKWWAIGDLNTGPHPYQTSRMPITHTIKHFCLF